MLLSSCWLERNYSNRLYFPYFFIYSRCFHCSFFHKANWNGEKSIRDDKKIFIRALKIYAVGIFLWLWPSFNFDSIRWVGVLHRIAFVFLIVQYFFYIPQKNTNIFRNWLLLFYWIVMVYIPVPGIGAPDLSFQKKLGALYRFNAFTRKIMEDTWDPEGILSTLPSVATGIMGMISGYILLGKEDLIKK